MDYEALYRQCPRSLPRNKLRNCSGRTPRREAPRGTRKGSQSRDGQGAGICSCSCICPHRGRSKGSIDAAVAAALAAKDAELRTEHQTDIEKAFESGRLEGTMKLRLNNTQLIRAQSKVKELELQIEEWKKVGVVPGESAAPSASVPPAASLSLCPARLSCQNALALLSARPFI